MNLLIFKQRLIGQKTNRLWPISRPASVQSSPRTPGCGTCSCVFDLHHRGLSQAPAITTIRLLIMHNEHYNRPQALVSTKCQVTVCIYLAFSHLPRDFDELERQEHNQVQHKWGAKQLWYRCTVEGCRTADKQSCNTQLRPNDAIGGCQQRLQCQGEGGAAPSWSIK